MKNRVLIAVVLFGPLALLLMFWCQPGLVKTSRIPLGSNKPSATSASALATQNLDAPLLIHSNFAAISNFSAAHYASVSSVASQPAGPTAPLEFTNLAPETVMQNMRRAIRQFGERLGGNPVGTNPEITAQLAGQNKKHLRFISEEAGLRINAVGELIDPWGTPFFFHQISGRETEIHSAGPDRTMWTADDLVTE